MRSATAARRGRWPSRIRSSEPTRLWSLPMTIDNLKSPDLAALSLAPASRPATAPSPEAPDVLRLDDLHISVHDGAALAVRGISLSIRAGEIVGLVGESGSGKTLTCRAALGVLPPGVAARGKITFAGDDVTDLSRRGWERLHGSHIGAVFQDPASYLNPNLTVGSQVTEVLRVKRRLTRAEAREKAV